MRYLPLALVALLSPALALDGTPAAAPSPAPAKTTPANPAASAPAAAEEAGPPTWIYMVARVKLTDTDLTQVSFLRHPAIDSLEACEAERTAGLTTGWRHFNRHYFKTLKGISYKVDFRCVEGTQYLATWYKGGQSNRNFLVKTTEGKLEVTKHASFFDCRRDLRKHAREETIDLFCGMASQDITEAPVTTEESDTAPEAGGASAPLAPAAPPAAAKTP